MFALDRVTVWNGTMHMRKWITIGSLFYSYVAMLFIWFLFLLLFEDRWWWLFLLNEADLLLFLPLPTFMVYAFLLRQPSLYPGIVAALTLGIYLHGGLFVPHSTPTTEKDGILTVMSFNVLESNRQPEGVVGVIQATKPDIVLLQELNFTVAEALWRDLSEPYPYQAPDISIQTGLSGMGIVSRYPLQRVYHGLSSADWIGQPQMAYVDVDGTRIIVLNVHATSIHVGKGAYRMGTPKHVAALIEEHEQEAQALVDVATTHAEPLVVAGDFNMGEHHTSYTMLTTVLQDTWHEAGWGAGRTFPGIAYVPLPMWSMRFDYVFCSHHWDVVAAQTGPWDGVSDHRPITAHIRLYHE